MKWWWSLLAVPLVLIPFNDADACATMETPFLSATRHPDRPFAPFAAGKLGILKPTFRPMYLIPAYRQMTGLTLTPEQQAQLVSSWQREQGDVPPSNEAAVEAWNKASGDHVDRANEEANYASYQRINSDAFLRAVETMNDLKGAFAKSPELFDEWLATQKAVFGPCGGDGQLPIFQDRSNAGIPPALLTRRADERQYQEAAVSFYCGNWDQAVERFEAIAKSKTSPWRGWGKFLAARALLRKASLTTEHSFEDESRSAFAAQLRAPEARLRDVLEDKSAKPSWAAARRLYGFVRFRTEPDKRRCELFPRVLEVGSGAALESEIVDLSLLLREAPTQKCTGYKGAAADLQDWLTVLASGAKRESYEDAKEHWKQGHSIPWLVASLMLADESAPELEPILEAAKAVDVGSPAGLTVRYYAARLFRLRGDGPSAQALLAQITPAMYPGIGAENLIKSELALSAKSWPQVYANAARTTAGIDNDEFSDADTRPAKQREHFFAEDARTLSRFMTAARILEMSQSNEVPPELRRSLRWTAFAKATMVNDEATMKAAALALAAAEPAAKVELEAMLARKTPDDRRMDAMVLLMGLPVVSPFLEPGTDRYWNTAPEFNLTNDESWLRNWWCDPAATKTEPVAWTFVDESERKAAEEQWQTLSRSGSAFAFFSALSLQFAKAHPDDVRAPLALYRVVRMTKRGCGAQNTKEGKEVFRYLHQKYAKSAWADRAKYVY